MPTYSRNVDLHVAGGDGVEVDWHDEDDTRVWDGRASGGVVGADAEDCAEAGPVCGEHARVRVAEDGDAAVGAADVVEGVWLDNEDLGEGLAVGGPLPVCGARQLADDVGGQGEVGQDDLGAKAGGLHVGGSTAGCAGNAVRTGAQAEGIQLAGGCRVLQENLGHAGQAARQAEGAWGEYAISYSVVAPKNLQLTAIRLEARSALLFGGIIILFVFAIVIINRKHMTKAHYFTVNHLIALAM